MYLSGIGKFPGAGDPFSGDRDVLNQGTDPDDCRAGGGIPSYTEYTAPDERYRGWAGAPQPSRRIRNWTCQVPVSKPAPAAPITISVPTSVQTQVSPQVSPVFVQQDEPQNSPVSAGTVQASPSPQSASFSEPAPVQQYSPVPQGSSVDTRNAMFDDYLQKMLEQQARDDARQQALIDAYAARSSPVNYGGVSAPSLGPSVAMPEYPAPVVAGPIDHSLRNGLLVAVAGVALSAYISKRKGSQRSRSRKGKR